MNQFPIHMETRAQRRNECVAVTQPLLVTEVGSKCPRRRRPCRTQSIMGWGSLGHGVDVFIQTDTGAAAAVRYLIDRLDLSSHVSVDTVVQRMACFIGSDG